MFSSHCKPARRARFAAWGRRALFALGFAGACAHGQPLPLPLVDTHSHFQSGPARDFRGALQTALEVMDRVGIERTILMSPPFPRKDAVRFYDIEDLLFARAAHPQRVVLMGGGSLNVMIHETPADAVTPAVRQAFRERAEAILAQGSVGFGEIAVHHVSIPAMGSQHAYENVPATHPLLLLLADIAAERDVPIDLHFDLVPQDMPLPPVLRPNPLNPDTLKANAEAFKALLAHNPRARIVWSHVGFEPLLNRHPQRVRQFLREFPNLSMSFRLANGNQSPASALGPDGRVKQAWIDLVSEFPDRFLLGSDAFYERGGIARGSSEQGLANLRALVEALPQPAAAAVAGGNAARLYKLPAAAAQGARVGAPIQ